MHYFKGAREQRTPVGLFPGHTNLQSKTGVESTKKLHD